MIIAILIFDIILLCQISGRSKCARCQGGVYPNRNPHELKHTLQNKTDMKTEPYVYRAIL